MKKINIGIVTVSDRASAGVYEDLSGIAIIDTLNEYLISDWQKFYKIIPDEQKLIEQTKMSVVGRNIFWPNCFQPSRLLC